MGPQAGVELLRLMTAKSIEDHAARANDDFPAVDLFSVPVPDFIGVDSPSRPVVSDMLDKRLRSVSQDEYVAFGIACNTVHMLADDLLTSTDIPFISMIAATVQKAMERSAETVGILASPTTLQTDLYQSAAEQYGLRTVLPQEHEVIDIERAIRSVIAGEQLDEARSSVQRIATRMLGEGADCIILGCTELPLLFIDDTKDNEYVSSLSALADELLRAYYEQGRPH